VADNGGNSATIERELEISDGMTPRIIAIPDKTVDEDTAFTIIPQISDDDPDILRRGSFLWVVTGPESFHLHEHVMNSSLETPGEYTVIFHVKDTGGNEQSVSFGIHVNDTTPPSVDAGQDLSVKKGSFVEVSGNGTQDNDPAFPLGSNFFWEVSGLLVQFSGYYGNFTADLLGEYTVRLTVVDGSGNIGYDEFTLLVTTDGIKPEILASSPQNGMVGFSPVGEIFIEFTEPMATDIAKYNIILREAGGDPLRRVISWSSDATRMYVDPQDRLLNGRDYILEIGEGLTDLSGEQMEPVSFEFRTRSELKLVDIRYGEGDSGSERPIMIKRSALLYLEFTERLDANSTVRIISGGSYSKIHLKEEAAGSLIYSIEIPSEIPSGECKLELDSLRSVHGELFSGENSITFTIREEKKGGGFEALLVVIFALLIITSLVVVYAVLLLIRRKREDPQDIELNKVTIEGTDDISSSHNRGKEVFYPEMGNQK
jgi:hypothetical protein